MGHRTGITGTENVDSSAGNAVYRTGSKAAGCLGSGGEREGGAGGCRKQQNLEHMEYMILKNY